jgi:hypothetical protein
MVDTVAELFRPLTMLFSVDWVIPHFPLSPFTVSWFSRHNSRIRRRMASFVLILSPLFLTRVTILS